PAQGTAGSVRRRSDPRRAHRRADGRLRRVRSRSAGRRPSRGCLAPMGSPATWLVDTSALARPSVPAVRGVLRPLIDAGRVAVTAVTLLEAGYTARSKPDHERSQQSVLQRLQFVYDTPRSERRALEVQQLLMERGHHRPVKLPD